MTVVAAWYACIKGYTLDLLPAPGDGILVQPDATRAPRRARAGGHRGGDHEHVGRARPGQHGGEAADGEAVDVHRLVRNHWIPAPVELREGELQAAFCQGARLGVVVLVVGERHLARGQPERGGHEHGEDGQDKERQDHHDAALVARPHSAEECAAMHYWIT